MHHAAECAHCHVQVREGFILDNLVRTVQCLRVLAFLTVLLFTDFSALGTHCLFVLLNFLAFCRAFYNYAVENLFV